MSEIRQFEGILTYVDADGNELEMYPEVKTDTTLSVSGKPADAKAVGEKLKNVGSGGNAKAVTISREEFEALSEEEKNSGIYVIPDGDDLTAKNLFYDGSLTGLGNNVQDAIDEQNKKFGIELLWSNPNPKSEFSAQTVNIDTSKYSRFLVLASYWESTEYTLNELLNVKGIVQTIHTTVTAINKRAVTVNDNGIAFNKGVLLVNNSWIDSNGNNVPKFIYGVY